MVRLRARFGLLLAAIAAVIVGLNSPVWAETSLQRELTALFERSELRDATVGVSVVELPSGRALYRQGAQQSLVPASNMKLVTMSAALELLGENYRYRTLIGLRGADLVVVGSGDPTIGQSQVSPDARAHFRLWAYHLRRRGITEIRGDLVLDDTLFDRQFIHPNWPRDQLDRWYVAPVGALSFNGNCVDVAVRPAPRAGAPAFAAFSPPYSGLRLSGTIGTVESSKQHRWAAGRKPESERVQISGRFSTRAAPATSSVTVIDPTHYFGESFARVLRQEGLRILGDVRSGVSADQDRLLVQVVHETSLEQVLPLLGKESQNFAAEQLFKKLGSGVGQASRQGSWNRGQEAVKRFLQQQRLPLQGVRIDDGSGLSHENRLTADFVTALLQRMFVSEHGRMFRESLAVAGVDGTLEKRFRATPYQGRIWAKTGTLAGVSALSGYVQTRDGRWRAFSLLVNHVRLGLRNVQDDFCRILVDE